MIPFKGRVWDAQNRHAWVASNGTASCRKTVQGGQIVTGMCGSFLGSITEEEVSTGFQKSEKWERVGK